MIELLRGSFGDDQPRFMVLMNQPVTPDQIDKIAELLNKVAEEGRAQVAGDREITGCRTSCVACDGNGCDRCIPDEFSEPTESNCEHKS